MSLREESVFIDGAKNGVSGSAEGLESSVFTRVEKKYLITSRQLDALTPVLLEHMHGDKYGLSTVCSMYFDTPDMRIIRASIDAKTYKEKLRLRCYGVPNDNSKAFVELKKKLDGVVYKRRFTMPYAEAMAYLTGGGERDESQIAREVDYFLRFYPGIRPALDIFCERIALFDNEDPNLRLTVDRDIRYRVHDLDLACGSHGTPITEEDTFVLEIKTQYAMPLWLTHLLDRNGVYPHKFSKFATAFNMELERRLGR